MLLDFPWIEWAALGIDAWSDHVRTLIHVGEKESGADAGAGVQSRTTISIRGGKHRSYSRKGNSPYPFPCQRWMPGARPSSQTQTQTLTLATKDVMSSLAIDIFEKT